MNGSLRTLAVQVLRRYDMTPEDLTVIQSGTIKTVWKFRCGGREYCLKRLKQRPDKALFSVHAQIYIKSAGGNVAEIIRDTGGEPIVSLNNELFVVYTWLRGRDLDFSDLAQLALAVEGLTKFHVSSKGYKAPEGACVSSKLGRWPHQYASMTNRLRAWKETAGTRGAPQHGAYLSCVEPVAALADEALALLLQSKYGELAAEGSRAVVLCHQDYGKGNALLTDGGIAVLDLDNVTFDLPSRDLRKIIGKISQNRNRWERRTVEEILHSYTGVNPMTEEEKSVLYIDLLYPHWFFGLVKNQYEKSKDVKAAEIERTARLELSKVPVVRELLER